MAVEMDKRLGHRESNLVSCNGFTSQNPGFPSSFGKNSQKLVRPAAEA
jgi:hypothetical protein